MFLSTSTKSLAQWLAYNPVDFFQSKNVARLILVCSEMSHKIVSNREPKRVGMFAKSQVIKNRWTCCDGSIQWNATWHSKQTDNSYTQYGWISKTSREKKSGAKDYILSAVYLTPFNWNPRKGKSGCLGQRMERKGNDWIGMRVPFVPF